LVWQIEFDPAAVKELGKLDKPVQRRIVEFLQQRVATNGDPRSLGEALRGDDLGHFWKYRLGDYRVVVQIIDKQVTVIVIRIGHRREV
jgi:mRNA interferase RelE/StbE